MQNLNKHSKSSLSWDSLVFKKPDYEDMLNGIMEKSVLDYVTIICFPGPNGLMEWSLFLLCASAAVSSCYAHASVIMPPSRNAIDGEPGTPWSDGKHPPTGWLMPYSSRCTNGTSTCNSGQSAFWFSQGMSFGRRNAC